MGGARTGGGGKIREKYIFTQHTGRYHVKFGHFYNFSYIFSGKNALPPKLTEQISYAYAKKVRENRRNWEIVKASLRYEVERSATKYKQ